MVLFEKSFNCCGCSACAESCPVGAITMTPDEMGFLYPKINNELCINCNMCKTVCAFNDKNNEKLQPLMTYAAASKNEKLLSKSTSGAVFAEIATYFLENDAVVYGSAYDSNFNAGHIEIEDINDLYKIQGSKYIQSDTSKVFKQIRNRLKENRLVLFSGTPCQVSAVRSFLGKPYENLYCIDLICHGVGAKTLFQEDLKYIAKGQKVQDFKFRDKKFGWATTGSLETNAKSVKYSSLYSPYYYYYLANAIFRDSCYHCKFPTETRVGDITLGDYWQIESAHPEIEKTIDQSKGLSCVLVNNEKGEELFNKIENSINYLESTYEKASNRNGQLVKCCSEPDIRRKIFDNYSEGNYEKVIDFWKKHTQKQRLILKVKSLIPNKLKKILKKF